MRGRRVMGNPVIKNAEIITMNKQEEIIRVDVRIKDNLIVEIGTDLIPQGDEKVIDATNRTLIPGFIQTHIHLCQTLFRGKGDDLELLDWLRKRIWPLEAAHDEESLNYSAMLGFGELISSGTTTIVDMETNCIFRYPGRCGNYDYRRGDRDGKRGD
jgi:cytosine/adenosine deaminase-related metal-dependent hydrolase